MLSFDEVNEKIWDLKAEVFLPCAASRLITKDQVDRMIAAGMEVIAAGANVPFADPEIFFGPIADFADDNISIIPDFISNCGMARVFAYLMSNDIEQLEEEVIFADTSNTIKEALIKSHAVNSSKYHIAKTAFEIALKQLV
jgi:glutamate dehydrogenase/leucine dehydrogenase